MLPEETMLDTGCYEYLYLLTKLDFYNGEIYVFQFQYLLSLCFIYSSLTSDNKSLSFIMFNFFSVKSVFPNTFMALSLPIYHKWIL